MDNITIHAHHVDITSSIKEYVEKKLGKLDKYFEHIQEINVDLDIAEVSDVNQRQIVKATAWVSGSVIRAQESSKDMYASVDLVFDKLERQLVKHKEKLKLRNKPNDKRSIAGRARMSAKDNQESASTVEKRRYIPKPMHPEDAASIMTLEGLEFLVFRNAESEEINVVYEMENGELGLIEP